MNRTKLKIFFICFAVFTALLRYIASSNPQAVEALYSKGLFPCIRWIFDHTIHYSFIPMIFVFLFFGILYLMHIIVRPFRSKHSLLSKLKRFGFSLISFLAILYTSFMWLWGFNYLRVPVEQSMSFEPKPILVKDLKSKLVARLPELMAARKVIPGVDAMAIDTSYMPPDFEEKIRTHIQDCLIKYDYPAHTDVQGRFLPKGILLRIKTAGVYFPFVGESNIDAGLHPLQYSETLAHEFSHGYGFGDEGTCSFIAYLALKDSDDPFIRYSLLLDYWRTLATNYLRYDNEDYRAFRGTLPIGLIADLDAIAENRRKYPSIFPNARNVIYDSYLKAQGIEEGLQNYNRVIMLVEGYEGKELGVRY